MIRFAYETVEQCWDELVPMVQEYFESIGKSYLPAYDRYREYEEADSLFVVTARDGHRLVGIAVMYVCRSMHTQLLGGQEDLFYLRPEYRKGWNALKLLSMAEEKCQEKGCVEINMSAAIGSKSGAILSGRGYGIVSQQYCKPLAGPTALRPQRTELSK